MTGYAPDEQRTTWGPEPPPPVASPATLRRSIGWGIAVVACGFGFVLGALAVLVAQSIRQPSAPYYMGAAGDLAIFDHDVGDCVDGLARGRISPVTPVVVPCAEPHQAEVIGVSPSFPVDAIADPVALDDLAVAWCLLVADPYLGTGHQEAELELHPILPHDDEAWRAAGRAVRCVAVSVDGSPLVGSVAADRG